MENEKPEISQEFLKIINLTHQLNRTQIILELLCKSNPLFLKLLTESMSKIDEESYKLTQQAFPNLEFSNKSSENPK